METANTPLVEMVPLDTLKPFDRNPRTMTTKDFEDLQRSIKTYGFIEPIIANKTTGHIVGGHQRLRAARALHLDKVPVVWVKLNQAQESALNIALNKISGEWDEDLLAELIFDLDDDMKLLTGFSDDEIAHLQDGFVDDLENADDGKTKVERYTVEELESRARVYLAGGGADTTSGFLRFLREG